MKYVRNVLLAILVAMIGIGVAACTAQSDGGRAQVVLTRYFSLLHEGQ